MKKSIKVCLILGSVLTVIGIGITVSAAAMGASLRGIPYELGLDYFQQRAVTDLQTSGESSVFYNIESLELEINEGYVSITEAEEGSPSDEITVYSDSPYAKVQLEESRGVLKIKSEVKDHGFGWRRFQWKNQPSLIQIKVPKGYEFNRAEMEFGATDFQADFLYAQELDLDTGVGTVTIRDGRIGKLKTRGGVGELDFQGEITGDTSIKNGVGDMNFVLTGFPKDYNYKIECGIGSVTVDGSSYSGLAAAKRIDNQAGRWMDIKCGVGEISIRFVEEER